MMESEAKVTINKDIVLDFTGLFSNQDGAEPASTGPLAPPSDAQPRTRKPMEQAGELLRSTQPERGARERSLEICRTYQENTKASNRAQTFILKGLQAGENPYKLLLAACECIGHLTGNRTFSVQASDAIETIAGRALLEPQALELELEGIQHRLAMMTRPELEREPEDSRRRIAAAIRVHQQRAGEIEKVLHNRAELEERERLVMAERAAKLERMESDPEYREQVEAAQRATLGLIS